MIGRRAAVVIALVGAMLGGCVHVSAVETRADTAPAMPAADPGLAGIQYLYGSGEAAAISVQAWWSLVAYVREQQGMQFRAAGTRRGVVLDPGSTLAAPVFQHCGAKPLAVVFDVDETVLLNLGYARDAAAHPGPFDPVLWAKWERAGAAGVVPVPGARDGIAALRRMGIAVIFNTNRSAENAAGSEAALNGAGVGPAKHGETLFLAGDDATGSHKDARRAAIAARYCVVAMGGDQLGDFSDLFNDHLTPAARRAAVTAPPIAALWGRGWFVLPNPSYGTALKGDYPTIFAGVAAAQEN